MTGRVTLDLIEERRQWEAEALKDVIPKDIECAEEKPGGVRCLRVRKKSAAKDKVILYLHGGGLISGSAMTHRSLAARLTGYLHIPLLLVDYRLLPENPYPAPLDDALVVYRYLIEEQDYSSENIVLAGDSSGAGLALSLLVKLRDTGVDTPAKAFMLSGAFDATLSGNSMTSNDGKDPMLSFQELIEWRDTYHSEPAAPLLSPFFADLQNLPPILLLAGDWDLWLSDSERVAEKIAACGGEVDLQVYESMGHVWFMDAGLPDSKSPMSDIKRFLGVEI